MLFKKPKHRVFDYQPRYYKPEEDASERRKRKLGFKNNLRSQKKSSSFLILLILLILVIYVIYLLYLY